MGWVMAGGGGKRERSGRSVTDYYFMEQSVRYGQAQTVVEKIKHVCVGSEWRLIFLLHQELFSAATSDFYIKNLRILTPLRSISPKNYYYKYCCSYIYMCVKYRIGP